MSHKRLCYSCDLKDDSKLIEEYKAYHAAGKAWPEITKILPMLVLLIWKFTW